MNPVVSVIVPVLHDADAAIRLVRSLAPDPSVEVIVVDGGADPALAVVEHQTERQPVRLIRSSPGRARQMNAGAAAASGEWLLFLHADSRLSSGWLEALLQAPTEAIGGWFRFALESRAWQARVIERGVAWRVRLLRLPYGDQGIFVRRRVFDALGGYEELPFLEDVALVRRLVAAGPVFEPRLPLFTSARRWQRDGWFRRSARNLAIVSAYLAGAPPARLSRWYARR